MLLNRDSDRVRAARLSVEAKGQGAPSRMSAFEGQMKPDSAGEEQLREDSNVVIVECDLASDYEMGIQIRFGDPDLLALRRHSPLGGTDIGSSTHEIGGDPDGHFRRRLRNVCLAQHLCQVECRNAQ